MHQEVHAIVRVTLIPRADLTQGQLLKFIHERTKINGARVELIGVLEEAEIYHPEGIS